MPVDENSPYEIHYAGKGQVIVRFAVICDHPRLKAHEDALADLVARSDAVACDLSETSIIASDWLRWLGRMAINARNAGKHVAVAGASEAVKATSDVLGLDSALKFVDKVEDVWNL
jgi:anti-anti-sigma regulatory factor